MVRPHQRAVIPQAISGFAALGVPGRLEMALDDHVAVPNDIRTVGLSLWMDRHSIPELGGADNRGGLHSVCACNGDVIY